MWLLKMIFWGDWDWIDNNLNIQMSGVEAISFDEVECGKKVAE